MIKWPAPYRYACPLYGLLAEQTSEMKNILLFDDVQNPLRKLLSLLFHLTVGNEFRITSHEPYCKFTIRTLLPIVKWMLQLIKKEEQVASSDLLIDELRSTFIGNKNPSRLKKLFNTIKDCLHFEQEKKIRAYGTLHALVTFVYLKAQSSSELDHYMKELYASYHQSFEEHAGSNSGGQKLLELVIDAAQKYNTSKKFLGTVQFLRTLSYKNNPPIADCTEAVLLDIARIIYTNLSKQNYQSPVSIFFTKYSPDDCATNHQARQEWLALCSEHHDISYRKNDYEVNPSIKNMIILLRRVFAIPVIPWWRRSFTDWNSQFNKLCIALSDDSFSMQCLRLQSCTDTRADIKIQFQKVNENLINRLNAYLHIRKDHMWISRTLRERKDFSTIIDTLIEQEDSSDHLPIMGLYSADILNQLYSNSYKLRKEIRMLLKGSMQQCIDKLTQNDIKQLLFTLPTDSDEEIYQLTKNVIQMYRQTNNDYYHSFATKAINAVTDNHFLYKSLLTIANYGLHQDFKSSIMKKLPDLEIDEQEDITASLTYHKAYKDPDYAKICYH